MIDHETVAVADDDVIIVTAGIEVESNPPAPPHASDAEPLMRAGVMLLAMGKELLAIQANPQDHDARTRLRVLLAEARPLADTLAGDETLPPDRIQQFRDIITRSEQMLKGDGGQAE